MPDIRHLFLCLDKLRTWDSGLYQHCAMPEKVPITGLEPGPGGSWDARVASIYGSVLKEDGLFRMWYCVMPDAENYAENPDHILIAYAESDDGIHWRKPDLGITGRQRYPGNNLLPLPGAVMGVAPALPGMDYKYLACTIQIGPLEPDVCDVPGLSYHGNGTYFFASDDGFHWRQLTERPILEQGDVASLIADPAHNRYLLYQKVGMMHGLDARRSFIGLESRDGVHWEGFEDVHRWRECFLADDYDDLLAQQAGLRIMDHYGVAVYPVSETFYVSVESLFYIGSPLVFRFAQNPNGIAATRLGFSHNGMDWRNPRGRPTWLGLGKPGDFDAGFIVTANTFLEHGDDLLLYYGGSRGDHGWSINEDFSMRQDIPLEEQRNSGNIGLARIKRDRFASLSTTFRSQFSVDADMRTGEALYVNAGCPQGSLRVAIYDLLKNQPLPGFTLDDCYPITGDHLRAPVCFKGARVRDIPKEKWIKLHFALERGEVFGYAWGEEEA
ncbi:MAG: hypothetical protein ACYDCO_25900 [Armatimonadota bacterium]